MIDDSSVRMSDEPIHFPEDDVLGRDELAQIIAADLEALDLRDGAVVAINGPWGSGKTSLIHLVIHHLGQRGRIVSLFFNPWMFSDSEELVGRFFEEVSGQLSETGGRAKVISAKLAKYGDALAPLGNVPLVGGYAKGVSLAMKTPNQIRTASIGSLHEQREQLRKHLSSVDTPFLIVVDDIDRLERKEIREILKLVRLTGNFPNVLYLLAYDRRRVERAVLEGEQDEEDSRTSNFLDKIVQFDYEVPELSPTFLARQLELGIGRILADVSPLKIDPNGRFPRLYWDLFAPIFTSLRDVKRYLGSLRATFRSVGNRVDFHDLLTFEAIRVLRPDLFTAIRRHRSGLAFTEDDQIPFGTDSLKARAGKSLQALMDAEDPEYVAALVKHLFQYANSLVSRDASDNLGSLLSSRRVAHRDVLNYYLGRFEGRYLRSSALAHEVLLQATTIENLEHDLQSIDQSDLPGVLRALAFETQDIERRQVEPLITAVLNIVPSLPWSRGSIFEISPQDASSRIVFNAIKSVDVIDRTSVIRACLSNIYSLEGKRSLFDVIADDSPVGGALASPELLAEVVASIVDAYRERTPQQLSSEPKLLWLTKWLIDYAGLAREDVPDLLSYRPNALSLLRSAKYWNMNARSGEDSYTVDIDVLTEVLGDIGEVQRLIDVAREISMETEILDLASLLQDRLSASTRDSSDTPEVR